jgi:hypothetical protein
MRRAVDCGRRSKTARVNVSPDFLIPGNKAGTRRPWEDLEMKWVCQFCHQTYLVDDVVPRDPAYDTTHDVCPACSRRPAPKPAPMTREEWVLALMEALVTGAPTPMNPAWGPVPGERGG